MSATDLMLQRFAADVDEKQKFIDSLVEAAQREGRDLKPNELEIAKRARDEIAELHKQLDPMLEVRQIAEESATKLASISRLQTRDTPPQQMEYRSAGEYVIDRWRAGLGSEEAVRKLDLYHRAASPRRLAPDDGGQPRPDPQPDHRPGRLV